MAGRKNSMCKNCEEERDNCGCFLYFFFLKIRGSWWAPSEGHTTPDLGVVSVSPTTDVEMTLKKKHKTLQFLSY